jgi:hypothetical protein
MGVPAKLDGNVKPVLAGCGILAKEIRLLAEKNGWRLDFDFLPPALHVDLGLLAGSLTDCLARNRGRDVVVFYGCCHPLMDQMLEEAGTFRTAGQNCVEMLLGPERYQQELGQGAYFLLEGWARNWDTVTTKTFGPNRAVLRDILQGDRTYMAALVTPCSSDYSEAAEEAAAQAGLPLRWMDVKLDRLERNLGEAVARRLAGGA